MKMKNEANLIRRMIIRAGLLILLLAMICCAAAAETSGSEGTISWTLSDSGDLTITGSGEMTHSFSNQPEIVTVTIGEGITAIDYGSFGYCEKLKSVSLPGTLTEIRMRSFSHCPSLKKLNIPDGVTHIDKDSFADSEITLYAAIGSEGAKALSRVDYAFHAPGSPIELKYLYLNGEITGLGVTGADKNIKTANIPKGVTSIEQHAFNNHTALRKVNIPDSVTTIGTYSFANTKLENIALPDSVTELGQYAFIDCSQLKSITLSKKLKQIGYFAFCRCKKLEKVTLPKSLRTIQGFAFMDCTGLKKITIPKGVTSIGEGAFSGCDAIRYCTIGSKGAKALGKAYYTFRVSGQKLDLKYVYESGKLTGLTLISADKNIKTAKVPKGVTIIADHAFSECKKLTKITLPEGLKRIDSYAFSECVKLKTIAFPKSVNQMDVTCIAGTSRTFYMTVKKGSGPEKLAQKCGLNYVNEKKRVVHNDITSGSQKIKWIVANYVKSGMSEKETALVLHNWLIFNAHYDMSLKTFSPDGVLIKGYGVCQSYADAYEKLLCEAGLANRTLIGGNHEWNLVRIDGQWYHVDCTWDDSVNTRDPTPNEKLPPISGRESTGYFLRNDQYMRDTGHVWNSSISADKNQVGNYHPARNRKTGTAAAQTVTAGGIYETAGNQATFIGPEDPGAAEIVIPDSVEINGKAYKVTKIAKNACKDMKKLARAEIGKNVKEIGAGAFSGCAKLKTITIRTKKLTDKAVGADAFKGTGKKATVKCPKGKAKIYAEFLKMKGLKKAAFE